MDGRLEPERLQLGSGLHAGRLVGHLGAVTNLFVAHNRMHDFSYFLGFTEDNWNSQHHNFGLTEAWRQNDPVLGSAQAGGAIPTALAFALGARNNANMSTLPEGASSVTNMFLWQPQAGSFYPPCADGDYDMSIIGHEYGHMIENRTIGKGTARAGFHAGAMGEAFGDLVAIEYAQENSFDNGTSPTVAGAYATGNPHHGIRNYDVGFPSSGADPEAGQEPQRRFAELRQHRLRRHRATRCTPTARSGSRRMSVRRLLVDKYNKEYPVSDDELQSDCANGLVNVDRCPGNRRWMQLLLDGMLLMPPNTSMVQARDAVLAADLMRFGGANQKELWLAFARAGMGRNAASTNGGVNSDTDPLPDFDAVGTTPANVKFEAKGLDGRRSTRGSTSASTRPASRRSRTRTPATNASINVDDTAKFAPGTYEFVAHAPGYGHLRFRERFRSGRDKTIKHRVPDELRVGHSRRDCDHDGRRREGRQPDRRHRDHELDAPATNTPARSGWTARRRRSTWAGRNRSRSGTSRSAP